MTSSVPNILVAVVNGSEEMKAVIIAYVLRRAGANVAVASVESELQSNDLAVCSNVADSLLAEVVDAKFGLIVLPEGMPSGDWL